MSSVPPKRVVCVVDDDAMVRDALAVMLSTAGIEVVAFGSGEEFLEFAKPAMPICAILDVRLPGISGLELLRELGRRGGDTIVIIITGHGDVPMAVTAMRSGALHFIEKPLDPEEVMAAVSEALPRVEALERQQANSAAFANDLSSLTPRERDVMNLLIEGNPNKIVAAKLGISVRTTEHHRASVLRKMKARSLSHLIRMMLDLRSPAAGPRTLG